MHISTVQKPLLKQIPNKAITATSLTCFEMIVKICLVVLCDRNTEADFRMKTADMKLLGSCPP